MHWLVGWLTVWSYKLAEFFSMDFPYLALLMTRVLNIKPILYFLSHCKHQTLCLPFSGCQVNVTDRWVAGFS